MWYHLILSDITYNQDDITLKLDDIILRRGDITLNRGDITSKARWYHILLINSKTAPHNWMPLVIKSASRPEWDLKAESPSLLTQWHKNAKVLSIRSLPPSTIVTGGGGNLPWFWVRMCGWSPRTPPHSYTRPSEKHDPFIYFPYQKLTPFIYNFWKLTPFIYYFSNFTHSYTFWMKKIPHWYTFDVKMIPIHILGGLKVYPIPAAHLYIPL